VKKRLSSQTIPILHQNPDLAEFPEDRQMRTAGPPLSTFAVFAEEMMSCHVGGARAGGPTLGVGDKLAPLLQRSYAHNILSREARVH
jgi:hypothetical protein